MHTIEFIRPALEPAARDALKEHFDVETIDALLDEAFEYLLSELPTLDKEDSVGGTLMVRLASLTAGLYLAVGRRVENDDESRALTTSVTRALYSKMGRIPWAVGGVGAKSPVDRLRRATDVFRRFPFSAPSYVMVDVGTPDPNVVAFDVLRCPVAEYFEARGLSELCVDSWCSLDFGLARSWGAELERETEIASGDDRCRFRWHSTEEE